MLHPQPHTMDDGTPMSKDYGDSRNNRFFGPDSVQKTRFSPPTKVSCHLGVIEVQPALLSLENRLIR